MQLYELHSAAIHSNGDANVKLNRSRFHWEKISGWKHELALSEEFGLVHTERVRLSESMIQTDFCEQP